MIFLSPLMATPRWKLYFAWFPTFLIDHLVEGIDVKITFESLSSGVHLYFFNVCCICTNMPIHKNFALDILFNFQSFHAKLVPRVTGNGYWNMHIMLFKKECLMLFVKQNVIVSIIIHISTVLFLVHWWSYKFEGSRNFFYFSMIYCSSSL